MSEVNDQAKVLEKLYKDTQNEAGDLGRRPKFSIYKYGSKVHEINGRKYKSQDEFIDEMKRHVQIYSSSALCENYPDFSII